VESVERMEHLLEAGVDRVVVDPVLLTDSTDAAERIAGLGARVAAALELPDAETVRAVAGRDDERVSFETVASALATVGVQRVILRAVDAAGRPDLETLRTALSALRTETLISAPVRTKADLDELQSLTTASGVVLEGAVRRLLERAGAG
jgi:phosphoribosylformimino-5-aminoimidazole carboxamide ribonucleotide (ProFAR) isomerase